MHGSRTKSRVTGLAAFALLSACSGGETSGLGGIWLSEYGISASFTEHPFSVHVLASTEASGGICCAWSAPVVATEHTSSLVSAGLLTVTGGSRHFMALPGPDIQGVANRSSDVFYRVTDTQPVFSPGQPVELSFAGDVVPAFSVRDVAIPTPITLTQPTLADSLTASGAAFLRIDRAEDFPVTWTDGDATAKVSVELKDGWGAAVVCTFPPDTGGAVIPASILGYLSPTQKPNEGRIAVSSFIAQPSQMVGNWRISTQASTGEQQGWLTIQ